MKTKTKPDGFQTSRDELRARIQRQERYQDALDAARVLVGRLEKLAQGTSEDVQRDHATARASVESIDMYLRGGLP